MSHSATKRASATPGEPGAMSCWIGGWKLVDTSRVGTKGTDGLPGVLAEKLLLLLLLLKLMLLPLLLLLAC